MAQRAPSSFFGRIAWTCKRCHIRQRNQRAQLSSTASRKDELEIKAAPEIDFENARTDQPARVIPASPSYFTGSPIFNDNLLELQSLLAKYEKVPQLPKEKVPPINWLKLSQYQSTTGERVADSKYNQILRLLTRLNQVHPELRSDDIRAVLLKFQRPGASKAQEAKPLKVDAFGRSKGVGRRKEASARVQLIEGTGEVLINGKNIVEAFPRIHDRESAMWSLKISERIDKYNVFAMVRGGGITGQAEAVALGLAKALLVHEPALKPFLHRGKSK